VSGRHRIPVIHRPSVELIRIASGRSDVAPAKGDRRFQGAAAGAERGYHVLAFDGSGQGGALHH